MRRNLDREREHRYHVHSLYRDAAATAGILDLLRAPQVAASSDLLNAIQAEGRRAEAELEREQPRWRIGTTGF